MYLELAGVSVAARGFSLLQQAGPLFLVVLRLLLAGASLVAKHGLQGVGAQ